LGRDPLLRADESEAGLLARFRTHPVLRAVDRLDQGALLEILLQRRFLSLVFPVVYDLGIDGLTDTTTRGIAREILREEYPDPSGGTPSHREDLVSDLLALGATRPQILASRPTEATAKLIEQTLALLLDASACDSDVEVLTILRFWGEVLVSVEYGELWRRMERLFQSAGVSSCFYDPHVHHDGSDSLLASAESVSTHSGRLGARLARLLLADDAVERFCHTERQLLAGRMGFYDQFGAPATATLEGMSSES
jgi:hypothetical protein